MNITGFYICNILTQHDMDIMNVKLDIKGWRMGDDDEDCLHDRSFKYECKFELSRVLRLLSYWRSYVARLACPRLCVACEGCAVRLTYDVSVVWLQLFLILAGIRQSVCLGSIPSGCPPCRVGRVGGFEPKCSLQTHSQGEYIRILWKFLQK